MENNTQTSQNVVEIENVSLRYNKPTEKIGTLKEFFVRLFKGKLRYSEFWVLNDINLTVKKGESLALVGTNGSGKTTLLKLIAGILHPSKGSIKISGSIAPLINLGAGFDMEATARENIFLNGAILGYSKKEMMQKYDSIVKFAELEDFMNVPIKNFSSGMLSRLGFAIAVDVQPDILLVDEILAVGDINFRKKCQDKITEMLNNGTTLIYVSHSMNEVKALCQKCLWLKDSRTYMYGDSKDVVDKYVEYCNNPNSNKLVAVKSTENVVPIVYCADNNYADAIAVSIQSVVDNATDDKNYQIYILHDDEFVPIETGMFANLKSNIKINYVNISTKINKKELYSRAHFSKAMYYRWLIPEIFKDYDKVVYIDCDTVLNSDIANLIDCDLKDKVIGAVKNPLESESMEKYVSKILELNPNEYINSGVMLIDVKKFNQLDVKNKCLNMIRKNKAFIYPDQDVINIVLKGKIEFLEDAWNYQVGNEKYKAKNLNEKHIIHYTSHVKPWNAQKCDLSEYFWTYANKLTKKIEIKEPAKPKQQPKIIRIITKPFKLIARFFEVWKSFGFKKAIFLTKNKINKIMKF